MKLNRVPIWMWVAFIGVMIIVLLIIFFPNDNAGAGIGPNGFAQYARQGIININNQVYGKGNSPWIVTCKDFPNYTTLNDKVVCMIVNKNG